MADDLEQHILSIEGEGPSPDFVANLRKRIATEITASAEATDDEPVVAVVLGPDEMEDSMTRTRKIWLASAVAAAVLIAGLIALSRDGEEFDLKTVTTTEDSTTTSVPLIETTTSVPLNSTTTTVTVPEVPSTFAPDATPLPKEQTTLVPGFYRTETFSLPLSFTTNRPMAVYQNGRSRIALGSISSRAPGDLEVVFSPLNVDYQRWLEILDEGLAVLPREELTVDGLNATRIDIDASSCGEDTAFCADFGTKEAGLFNRMRATSLHRVWVIDQESQPPIAVIVAISGITDSFYFDVGEEIVLSFEFGEPDSD